MRSFVVISFRFEMPPKWGERKKKHISMHSSYIAQPQYGHSIVTECIAHTNKREDTQKMGHFGMNSRSQRVRHTEHTEEEQKKCCGDGKEDEGNDCHRRVEFPNTKLNAFPPTRATAHRWHFPQSRGDYRGLCAVKPYLIESSL